MQMQEELIAFVPVLLLLVRQLGFTPVVAVAMSLGTAAVGAAFSPVNPFQVHHRPEGGRASTGLGPGFPTGFSGPGSGLLDLRAPCGTPGAPGPTAGTSSGRSKGSARLARSGHSDLHSRRLRHLHLWRPAAGWEFDQLSALFFVVGLLAGLLGGWVWRAQPRPLSMDSGPWHLPDC